MIDYTTKDGYRQWRAMLGTLAMRVIPLVHTSYDTDDLISEAVVALLENERIKEERAKGSNTKGLECRIAKFRMIDYWRKETHSRIKNPPVYIPWHKVQFYVDQGLLDECIVMDFNGIDMDVQCEERVNRAMLRGKGRLAECWELILKGNPESYIKEKMGISQNCMQNYKSKLAAALCMTNKTLGELPDED